MTGVDELTAGQPEEVAVENARRKARAAAAAGQRAGSADSNDILLGVDTLVALDERLYGKPGDRREAAATLAALAGRRHRVVSGVCVIEDGVERSAAAVDIRELRPGR